MGVCVWKIQVAYLRFVQFLLYFNLKRGASENLAVLDQLTFDEENQQEWQWERCFKGYKRSMRGPRKMMKSRFFYFLFYKNVFYIIVL